MTHPQAVARRSARVVAVAPTGRILLLRGGDPARPGIGIWHAPGGGVEPGESDREAARREFAEETGRDIAIGAHVWDRHLVFSFDRTLYDQHEVFFTAEIDSEFEPSTDGHNELELTYLSGHAWFSPADLRAVAAPDLVAPADLADRLDDLLREGPPAVPVRVLGAVLP